MRESEQRSADGVAIDANSEDESRSLSRARFHLLLSDLLLTPRSSSLFCFPSAGPLASSSSATGGPPGKHLDLGIVVPPHRLLRTRPCSHVWRSAGPRNARDPRSVVKRCAIVCPFSCTGEGLTCLGAGRPSRPPPPPENLAPPLCASPALFSAAERLRVLLFPSHGTSKLGVMYFGGSSAILRAGDPAEQMRAAIDARSGDGIVGSRPHLLLSVAASNPPFFLPFPLCRRSRLLLRRRHPR